MTRLSSRDRAKVNAALLLIHDEGHNPDEVSGLAQRMMNNGTPVLKAYERAFEGFMQQHPGFRAPFMRIGQLMEASDERTVSGYNHALSTYIATGDNAAFDPIMDTLQQDLTALTARTGDAGFIDIDGWGVTSEPAPVAQPAEAAQTISQPAGDKPMFRADGSYARAPAPRHTEARQPYSGPRGWQQDDTPTFGHAYKLDGPGPAE